MKLIVGLGNPGAKYKNNRHNVGFVVLDNFVGEKGYGWRVNPDWMCEYAKSENFIVAKPTTFMNSSGQAVLSLQNFFSIEKKDVLIVHDDLDLDFGKVRVYFSGSAGGHHGVESVISSLGTPDFGRVRIGIGHPSRKASAYTKVLADRSDGKPSFDKNAVTKYVLEDFDEEEKKLLPSVIKRSVEAIDSYLDLGIEATKNKFD